MVLAVLLAYAFLILFLSARYRRVRRNLGLSSPTIGSADVQGFHISRGVVWDFFTHPFFSWTAGVIGVIALVYFAYYFAALGVALILCISFAISHFYPMSVDQKDAMGKAILTNNLSAEMTLSDERKEVIPTWIRYASVTCYAIGVVLIVLEIYPVLIAA